VLKARLALGKAITARGDYDRSIPVLQAAVDGYRVTSPESIDLPLALGELAAAHQYAGHLDVAQQLNDETLALDRQLRGGQHPIVGHDLLNQSDLANSRGHYEDSVRLAREAASIFEAWYGPDHPETASALVAMSSPLTMLKQLDEADAVLRRAQAALRGVPDQRSLPLAGEDGVTLSLPARAGGGRN